MAKQRNKKVSKGSAGQNRKNSEIYIDKYKQKSDVLETYSGLLYRVIEEGSGASPTAVDSVQTHQRVWLADGSVIQDSYKSGEMKIYSLREAIGGLQEGLPLMSIGARYEFVVPPELAWGKKGIGDKIGGNAVLTFDIRLIDIINEV